MHVVPLGPDAGRRSSAPQAGATWSRCSATATSAAAASRSSSSARRRRCPPARRRSRCARAPRCCPTARLRPGRRHTTASCARPPGRAPGTFRDDVARITQDMADELEDADPRRARAVAPPAAQLAQRPPRRPPEAATRARRSARGLGHAPTLGRPTLEPTPARQSDPEAPGSVGLRPTRAPMASVCMTLTSRVRIGLVCPYSLTIPGGRAGARCWAWLGRCGASAHDARVLAPVRRAAARRAA